MHYKWNLKEIQFTKDKGSVFSCFACGGGSTMGYKLAGFDVIGCNEIDEKLIKTYINNHHPKYAFLEGIQTFKNRKDLPKELYNLDILDGSPPCSSFSISGNREKDWGKEKKFKEGQKCQVLDTLFFDFIDLAKELKPKVIVAENVKGLLLGNAQKYVAKILEEFEKAGYNVQFHVLKGSDMGVPQIRERVFFIAFRNDLCKKFLERVSLFDYKPILNLNFNEKSIPYKEIEEKGKDIVGEAPLYPKAKLLWEKCKIGDKFSTVVENGISYFGYSKIDRDKVLPTITASADGGQSYHYKYPRSLSKIELIHASTFPEDYDFGKNKVKYITGMSVPPVVMYRISKEIHKQWLSKI